MYDPTANTFTTGTEQVLHVHDELECAGRACVIHNPSSHHMRDWPTHWRHGYPYPGEIKPPHMERICEHGVGHPDPDDCAYLGEDVIGIHGCDGCCRPGLPWDDPASAAPTGSYMEVVL